MHFKNTNSLAQPRLSKLESSEMGPSTYIFLKTSPEDPDVCHCQEIIIIMKTWSRSNRSAARELNLAPKVGEGFIEEEIAFFPKHSLLSSDCCSYLYGM